MSKASAIVKMELFFNAFQQFKEDAYNIDKVVFEIKDETHRGMGYAEGVLKYDALLEKVFTMTVPTNFTCKWKTITGISFIL